MDCDLEAAEAAEKVEGEIELSLVDLRCAFAALVSHKLGRRVEPSDIEGAIFRDLAAGNGVDIGIDLDAAEGDYQLLIGIDSDRVNSVNAEESAARNDERYHEPVSEPVVNEPVQEEWSAAKNAAAALARLKRAS